MRCETRISPITWGQSAKRPYTRQSRTPTIHRERREQPRPIQRDRPRRSAGGQRRERRDEERGDGRPDQVVAVHEHGIGAGEGVRPVEKELCLGVELCLEVGGEGVVRARGCEHADRDDDR